MFKTIIVEASRLGSLWIPYTPLCVDCGGLRSATSGQRCMRCYLAFAVEKREMKERRQMVLQQWREQRQTERAAEQQEREALRAVLGAARQRALEERERQRVQRREVRKQEREALRAEREALRESLRLERRELRQWALSQSRPMRSRRVNRDLLFQPVPFRLGSCRPQSQAIHDAISLDAPLKSDKRFGSRTLADMVAVDPTPNILERMIEAEGVQRIVERLSDERRIPLAQAQQIVDAIVDCEYLEEGSVYDLADSLRSRWQADRLLTPKARNLGPDFQRPSKPNPEPAEYDHWRRRYSLLRSGRVMTREVQREEFGGAWSPETALPEERRDEDAA